MGSFNRERASRDGGRNQSHFRARNNYNHGRRDDKQMFGAVCNNCGKDCEVPFRPTGDKPVYCSDCFEKIGDRDGRRPHSGPKSSERNGHNYQHNAQFEAINAKLDKILSLLKESPAVALESKMETKPPKPKKTILTQPKARGLVLGES